MAAHKKPKSSSHNSSHGPTKTKAKEILRDGSVRGKTLTKKQRGFFGARAGGATVKRIAR